MQQIVDDAQQIGRLGRLDQKGVGAEAGRVNLVVRVGIGRRIEHQWSVFQALVAFPLAAQAEAVHDRHQDVADDEIGRDGFGHRQRFGAIAGAVDAVAVAFEQDAEQIAILIYVIDYQHTSHLVFPRFC